MTLESLFRDMPNAPYLFIGSGFTRRYCQTPGWEDLLQTLAHETRPDLDYPLKYYESQIGQPLPKEKLFPMVASLMEREYNCRFFEGLIDPTPTQAATDFDKTDVNPFRVRLAETFAAVKPVGLNDALWEELSDFRVAMQHSLNGIITTNYDGFVEYWFNKFKAYIGQDDLIFSRAVGLGEIYKIHGCYTRPKSLVFTAEDYENFEKRRAYLVAKLLSIFMENPIIFIGYSASDPNIRGIFASIAGCLDEEHLKQLGKRIILVDYQASALATEVRQQVMSLGERSLTIHQIVTSDFRPICKNLLKVRRTYDVQLLRRAKEDLYATVISNKPADVIEVLNEHAVFNEEEGTTPRQVIGFTLSGHSGHNILHSEDVYRHVLLDEGDIDLKTLVEKWLPEKMGRCEYPIFGLVKKYQSRYQETLPFVIAEYVAEHRHLDDFIPKNTRKKRATRSYSRLADIVQSWSDIRDGFNKILCLDEEELRKPELWSFLQQLVEEDPSLLNSNGTILKRLIRVCDFLRN